MTNKKEPLVSIYIPTYNRPVWLKEALDSVLEQTYKNIEIIISNNCSEDLRVDKLCKEYASKDNRIRYFCQSENIGGGKNFEFCVEHVKGEYMLGLCDDDRIEPTYVDKTLKKLLSDKKAIACWSGINFMDEEGNPKEMYGRHDSPDCSSNNIVDNLVKWNMQSGWYGMFFIKSEYIKNNLLDVSYKSAFGEDVFMISQLLLKGKILKVDEPLYNYRTRETPCYTYRDYKDPSYNPYTNINPYADQLMRTFELVFETDKLNFLQKIEFYLKMWQNILFDNEDNWIVAKINLFPFNDFYKKLINEKNYSGLFYLYPIKIVNKVKQIQLFLKRISFFSKPMKENTVLVAELNNCHSEVIPGYVKYLLDLGYNVDILMDNGLKRSRQYNFAKDKRVNIIYVNKKWFRTFFSFNRNKKYEHMLFTSYQIFYMKLQKTIHTAKSYLPEMIKPQKKVLYVAHRIEQSEEELLKNKQIIALADLKYEFEKSKPVFVNAHYFGDIKITPKNENSTNFIIIGEITAARRNIMPLLRTLENLNQKENVKITVSSRTPIDIIKAQIPENLQKYFEFCGRLNFIELYKKLEEADFFLPLLDGDCKAHERYISKGTSGSFQLIYGFAKPCVIHSKFASPHGFTEQNSLIYKNDDEYTAMLTNAINMSQSDYKNLQNNLITLKNDIYTKSLNNLRNCLLDVPSTLENIEEKELTAV